MVAARINIWWDAKMISATSIHRCKVTHWLVLCVDGISEVEMLDCIGCKANVRGKCYGNAYFLGDSKINGKKISKMRTCPKDVREKEKQEIK